MNWINIILLLYVIGMGMIWMTYGMFSSFIHLCCVIAAGALAFAFWEPAAAMVSGTVPSVGLGVGLIVPFLVILVLLRVASDRLVRGYVSVPTLANQIGGALLGVVSGYLTAGVAVIGIGFLPIGETTLGYAPYTVNGNRTEPSPEGQLWSFLRADSAAASLFSGLSAGAFSPTLSDETLASERPNLVLQASLTRLRPDIFASSAIRPGSVTVEGAYRVPANDDQLGTLIAYAGLDALIDISDVEFEDVETSADVVEQASETLSTGEFKNLAHSLGLKAKYHEASTRLDQMQAFVDDQVQTTAELLGAHTAGGKDLFLVDTAWSVQNGEGTYDKDRQIRVPATQVRLLVDSATDGRKLLPPVGAGQRDVDRGSRVMIAYESANTVVWGLDEQQIAWAFALDANDTPVSLLLRGQRFALPAAEDVETQPFQVAMALGSPPLPDAEKVLADRKKQAEEAAASASSTGIDSGLDNVRIEQSTRLPRVISSNSATSLQRSSDNLAVAGGEGLAPKSTNRGRVRYINTTRGEGMVRMEIEARKAFSIFGQAIQAAKALQPINLIDSADQTHIARAYSIFKPTSQDQYIGYRTFQGYATASQLPMREVETNDLIYLYFPVPAGRTIVAYTLGGEGRIDLAQPFEVEEAEDRR